MIKERRDNRGRVLMTGESQLKNGSYSYRYVDPDGKRRSVSSWRLLPWDIGRDGTKNQECLRDMEERVRKSLVAGRTPKPLDENATVNDFWEKYLETKAEIAEGTLVSYIFLYNRHIKDDIGRRKIATVKYSEVKQYYLRKAGQGLGISSLRNIQNILGPIFQLAFRDGYIQSNPTDGIIPELSRRKDWQVKKMEALTWTQQERFVEFVSGSYEFREWLPALTLFLGCGLRVGELTGLVWQNVLWEKNVIRVDHTLNYKIALDGRCQYYITFPKTKNGARDIPMLEDVRNTLEALYERRDDFNAGTKIMVDGYTDFIFRDLNGRLYNGRRINENLRRMQKKYNEREEAEAKKHRRAPELMPDFTAHTLRHTFCTRCAEQKMPIHSLQYLMGHAHPETTIRVYSSIWDTTTQDAMAMMNGKFRIR
ncbi:MAG: site-specific integrase [Lachnospiraceae bacterium]|nr:site-specific integrase [Lachnospiraceae bacterium]